jgi:hypothetical protein
MVASCPICTVCAPGVNEIVIAFADVTAPKMKMAANLLIDECIVLIIFLFSIIGIEININKNFLNTIYARRPSLYRQIIKRKLKIGI